MAPSAIQALYPGSIADVAGLLLGHAKAPDRETGCTVVLAPPEGAVAGVAVRGCAPGTRETDLLRPEAIVQAVHAILLTGGSAFGLEAAGGVVRWLEEQGRGIEVAAGIRVPLVPTAVLFDLMHGDARIRPGPQEGYAACENALFRAASPAAGRAQAQGRIGAGAGATVGKLFGPRRCMPGGLGTASLARGSLVVGAVVAVNAVGDVIDPNGRILAGARSLDGQSFAHSTRSLLSDGQTQAPLGRHVRAQTQAGTATTIGVVATNASLDKAGASRLAALAHHGLSRAIDPISVFDGDTLFALSTGTEPQPEDATLLGVMAAEVVARAIRNAVMVTAD